MDRAGFPRGARVRKRGEFRRIQSQGRKVHTKHFIVLVHPSLAQSSRAHSSRASSRAQSSRARTESAEGSLAVGSGTRFGITITKKVGNAVERNRTKRVLREVFRRNRELFPPASDVVVIAKRGAPTLGYDEALRELRGIAKKLHRAKSPKRGARRTVEVGKKPTKRRK